MLEQEPANAGQETAQASGKKPKRFLCHRCQRNFARLEHLQRHERIRMSSQHWGPENTLLIVFLQIPKKSHLAAACVTTTSLEGTLPSIPDYRLSLLTPLATFSYATRDSLTTKMAPQETKGRIELAAMTKKLPNLLANDGG